MGYPIRLGSLYNLVLPHSGRAVGGKSNEPGDLEEMKAYYAKFDPRISKALSKVSECLRWKLEDLPPLPRWVSESGRVVLIGDAAHAMLPYLAQGAAMAIEDGAALGECLDRARSARDLRRVMHAFEAIRKPRCERIQASARGLGYLWHLPDGAQQEERDKAMKAVAVEGDSHDLNPNKFADEEFQAWMFGYDVFTATNKMLDAVLDPQSKL
jgi:salicylate hydroxylase